MKFNVNKDVLVRHRFWIILGLAVCIIFTGLFYLEFSVSADDARKAVFRG